MVLETTRQISMWQQEDINPSDFGDKLMDLACLEAKYNHSLCHLIRHLYCALINSTQQNLEDTLNAGYKSHGQGMLCGSTWKSLIKKRLRKKWNLQIVADLP
ncbi:Non-structural maintenance of chromosomes element 4-like protein A [Microtus ochrogaster]|uniref:Non-structural maintenance of chromosomes element 4-like protein A n=1 Tax=Microtus ochrogaster TaxID=79684 RepID=A0A8J6GBK1_MICOH|nr:Non-structural maintenance of chromosomes element 4-like protein A [Microtus ochrogaster]